MPTYVQPGTKPPKKAPVPHALAPSSSPFAGVGGLASGGLGLTAPAKGVPMTPAQKAAQAAASATAAGTPAPAAPPAPPDPKDSSYWNQLTALKNSRAGSYADIDRAHTDALQDQTDQIGQLVKARAAALIDEKNAANSRGLFYSSYLTNRDRDTNTNYDNNETAVNNAYTRGEADRASQVKALQDQYGANGSDSDFGTAGTQLLNDAIGRSLAAQAAAAPPPAPAAAPSAAPKKGFSSVQTTGPRAGLSFNVQTGANGHQVKVYENGDRVAA